jgi:hypothetical protein
VTDLTYTPEDSPVYTKRQRVSEALDRVIAAYQKWLRTQIGRPVKRNFVYKPESKI